MNKYDPQVNVYAKYKVIKGTVKLYVYMYYKLNKYKQKNNLTLFNATTS